MLKIALAGIPADGRPVSAVVPVRAVQPEDSGSLPVDEVQLEGILLPLDGDFLFRGSLTTVFSHFCDRCLASVKIPMDLDLLWAFKEGPPLAWDAEFTGNGEEKFRYQGSEIDLSACVWEELVLAAPLKYICREECAGLCPQCGADRNADACGCLDRAEESSQAHRGFADLAKRFPDLATADPESEE